MLTMNRPFRFKSQKPAIFRYLDELAEEEKRQQPKILPNGKIEIKVPMPFLHHPQSVKGPVVITEDWYVKTERKRLAKLSKEKRILQEEMMECLAEKDIIKGKLGKLNPVDKRDAKKIVKYNIKLRDIDAELHMLSNQAGITIEALEHGTRFQRFRGKISNWLASTGKKIKKWYKRNEHIIQPIAVIAITVFASSLATKVAKLISAAIV